MIRNAVRALIFSGITLLGAFLLVGLLTNAEAPVWLICVVALAFTCVMFLLHGGREMTTRRQGRRAGSGIGGYFVGSSDGGHDGGHQGGHYGGGHDSGGGWSGGWGRRWRGRRR